MPIVSPMEVKYCEDCRFCRKADRGLQCVHPMTSIENLVSRESSGSSCYGARIGVCGQEGKLFEAKPIVEKARDPVRRRWWHSLFRQESVNGS